MSPFSESKSTDQPLHHPHQALIFVPMRSVGLYLLSVGIQVHVLNAMRQKFSGDMLTPPTPPTLPSPVPTPAPPPSPPSPSPTPGGSVKEHGALSVSGNKTVDDATAMGLVEDPEGREIRAAEVGVANIEPCTAPYRACVDGYRMPSTCAFPFNYSGSEYQACIPSTFRSPWCSRDSEHSTWSSWDYCIPCTEQSIIPKTGQEEAILRKIACADIVITGGNTALEPERRAFTWINGFSPDTTQATYPAFSSGKWPGTVAIAGAVHTGHLSWDTRAAEVFEWWT